MPPCTQVHFYGIWTVYGTVRPDQLDPVLGTEAEFQTLVDTAHSYGIKAYSPCPKQKKTASPPGLPTALLPV